MKKPSIKPTPFLMSWGLPKPSGPRLPLSALDRPAVFETMRVYDGRVAGLDPHLGRLRASARTVGIAVPAAGVVRARVLEAVQRSRTADAIARFSICVTSGERRARTAAMFCLVRPFTGSPAAWYKTGVAVRTSSVRRADAGCGASQVKGNDYMNALNALITMPAAARSAPGEMPIVDTLFLTTRGEVSETTVSNIAMVRDGVLWTPPAPCGILLGITRKIILQAARAEGLKIREAPVTRHDLFNAEEVLLMNTAVEVLPVVDVDGRRIGSGEPGSWAVRLRTAYRQLAVEAE